MTDLWWKSIKWENFKGLSEKSILVDGLTDVGKSN